MVKGETEETIKDDLHFASVHACTDVCVAFALNHRTGAFEIDVTNERGVGAGLPQTLTLNGHSRFLLRLRL